MRRTRATSQNVSKISSYQAGIGNGRQVQLSGIGNGRLMRGHRKMGRGSTSLYIWLTDVRTSDSVFMCFVRVSERVCGLCNEVAVLTRSILMWSRST